MSFFTRKKQTQSQQQQPNDLVAQAASPAQISIRQQQQVNGPVMNIEQMTQSPQPQSTMQSQQPPMRQHQQLPQQLRTNSTSPRPVTFPWTVKQLNMLPQSPLPGSQTPPLTVISPPPFPRYGHSIPGTSNQNGELFLFGGLVRDSMRNDLYSINTRDLSSAIWEVKGEIPSPRVGHASAFVSNVLIVWGGDTKTNSRNVPGEKHDDGLYLLNLVTREWTRVDPEGPKPVGRYGHVVTMVGTRFYVFGGQVDGEFLNDLWSFDLNSLVKSEPQWERCNPASGNEPPLPRTGHACVAYDDQLFVFGGTDGSYHYNDTWSFDTNTRIWTDLKCIGFIPVPREGHSAALVDNVMYIFGGRGVDGKDLGDLTGFKISNLRWYMFQNMGPSPSGRSGHSMAAIGPRVFIIGGESYTLNARRDEPTAIHVLDTKHIKYPDSNKANSKSPKPSLGESMPPPSGQGSSTGSTTPGGSVNGQRAMPPQVTDPDVLRNRAVSPALSLNVQPFPNGQTVSDSIERIDTVAMDERIEDKIPGSDDEEVGERDSLDHRDHDRSRSSKWSTIKEKFSAFLGAQVGSEDVPDFSGLVSKTCYLGRGSSGQVFKAALKDNNSFLATELPTLAVKLLWVQFDGNEATRSKQFKKFRRELAVWRAVDHKNVLPLIGFARWDEQDTHPALLTLWMANGTVKQYLTHNPDADRNSIIKGVAEGLAYLHDQSITHGDMKGDNILINEVGIPLLCDFGLSRMVEDTSLWQTTAMQAGGTPY